MDTQQFIAAINQLCDEKGLSKDIVMETVKAAFKTAYRKDYGNRDQEIEVELNEKGDNVTIYLVKEVVKDVENEELEFTAADAKKYKKDAKVGDKVMIDVTPTGYGRIAAQSAKQVIIQRIQEAEREIMYETFKDRENELINALVHRVENNNVYLDLEKISTILPREHQIPGEKYYGGQRLKIYLDKVIKTTKGPQLIISRTHPSLLLKLLELEIPEINAGLVEVMAISREPGVRSKIAVKSNDENEMIDAVGSCVGQKGVRVQNVMNELSGERIDVIEWSEDMSEFINTALAPAKVTKLVLNDDNKRAEVYVEPDQRPLAIGKKGQNVRLASKLTGWELDIMDISDYKGKDAPKKAEEKEEVEMVADLSLAQEIIDKLVAVNLEKVEQLEGLGVKNLTDIEGITEEEAEEIVKAVKSVK